MFRWSEQSLEWYTRAGLAGTYFPRQAALLAPYLVPGGHVADLGCGPGLLSLELAGLGFTVTAIDIEPRAVAWLEREAAARGADRVRPVAGDALTLAPGTVFDDLVLSLFGCLTAEDLVVGGPGGIDYFRTHARHNVVIVVNTDPGRGHGRIGAPDMEAALAARSLGFRRLDAELDFGQPLESEEEARAFVSHYGASAEKLAWRLSRLERRPDGTCFLPHVKRLSVFVFPGTR